MARELTVTHGRKFQAIRDFVKNPTLYLLLLPAVLFSLLFSYIPMVGLLISFEDFNPIRGIFGSQFVGLQNFKVFFEGSQWLQVTFNTIFLNFLFIVSGTIASIAIAIFLTELGRTVLVRFVHSTIILPHFIGYPIVAMFSVTFLATNTGVVDQTFQALGLHVADLYTSPHAWPAILTITNLWKSAGFGSIVYMAAIMGIDRELYEAAKIDGATRMQRIFRITIPSLKPTIIILFLLTLGGLFKGNLDMIYNLVGNNTVLYPTTNVIDTYVFRALLEGQNFGLTTAVAFFQSILGFLIVFGANWLVKKVEPDYAIF